MRQEPDQARKEQVLEAARQKGRQIYSQIIQRHQKRLIDSLPLFRILGFLLGITVVALCLALAQWLWHSLLG